jgi:DNA polymerase-3 subunit epsilon
MENLSFEKPIAFIDLESTGKDPKLDRIVEIAIVKFNRDGNEESLNLLINPGISIPAEAIKVHGITDADVSGKPSFKESAEQIFDFIKDCDVAGFALKRFDLPFLEAEFQRAGISYNYNEKQIIDVMTIFHALEPRDLKAAYKKYCGKELEGAHRAEADVRAVIEILESQLKMHEDLPKDISGLHDFCNPRDPNWLDSEGKFSWSGNNVIFNFGNHKGKTLQEVFSNHKDYFNWILNKDFSPEVKEIIKNALNGIFPEK